MSSCDDDEDDGTIDVVRQEPKVKPFINLALQQKQHSGFPSAAVAGVHTHHLNLADLQPLCAPGFFLYSLALSSIM